MKKDPYYHYEDGVAVGTNYGRGKWCYDCNFGHTPDECRSRPANKSPRPEGASMYTICLVIKKEDVRDEVCSMSVRGFDSLSDAAEQMIIDFHRLNDANEISAKVDKLILALQEASDEHPFLSEAFIAIIEDNLK